MPRPHFDWRLRTRVLPLGRRTLLMGILNITPDSFSDGGRFMTEQTGLDQGLRLLDEGADLLDLGGESTRPNASPLSAKEEQTRILPVLRGLLKARPNAILSVDTYHAATARAALDSGAEIINDVSGLLWDPEMSGLLANTRPGAVLMHTRGRPRQWAELASLPDDEVLPLVLSGLTHTLSLARAAGLPGEHIVIDPGFGFGKRGDENFVLLAELGRLRELAQPILIGLSRKRFLTAHMAPLSDEARLECTSAAQVAAILAGAHVIRVHDMPAAWRAAAVADRVLASTPEPN